MMNSPSACCTWNQTNISSTWTKAASTHLFALIKQSTRVSVTASHIIDLGNGIQCQQRIRWNLSCPLFEALGKAGLLSSIIPTPTLGQLKKKKTIKNEKTSTWTSQGNNQTPWERDLTNVQSTSNLATVTSGKPQSTRLLSWLACPTLKWLLQVSMSNQRFQNSHELVFQGNLNSKKINQGIRSIDFSKLPCNCRGKGKCPYNSATAGPRSYIQGNLSNNQVYLHWQYPTKC